MAFSSHRSLMQTSSVFQISRNNKSGTILLSILTGFIFASVAVAVRFFVQSKRHQRMVSWENSSIVAALIFYFAQCSVVFWEILKGLGSNVEDLPAPQLSLIQKGLYVDNVLFILCMWLSKLSVAILLFKLSIQSLARKANGALIILMMLTAAVSMALIMLTCQLVEPWIWFDYGGVRCQALLSRWQSITVLDIATEVALGVSSMMLIHPLRLPWVQKAMVTFTFSQRILLLLPIGFRYHYVSKLFQLSNTTMALAESVICKEVEMAYAIFAAAIPCLQSFVTINATQPSLLEALDRQDSVATSVEKNVKKNPSLANIRSLTPLFGKERSSSHPRGHGPFELPSSSLTDDAANLRQPLKACVHPVRATTTRLDHKQGVLNELDGVRVQRTVSATKLKRRYTIEHCDKAGRPRKAPSFPPA